MKFIILAAILTIIYLAFFKKPSIKAPKKNKPTPADTDSDEMIACHTCQTYATKDDMILSNGHYFCSKTCVKDQP